MPDPSDQIHISAAGNLKSLFPGYYPPSEHDREEAYERGLVSLDANALLDLYRFTPKARNELFRVLELVKSRLFITHQAAVEFHRNRLSVVDERISVAINECVEIDKHVTEIRDRIRAFANRHQIDLRERENLLENVMSLSTRIKSSLTSSGMYDLDRDQVRDAGDAVLSRLDSLLEGRIGGAMDDAERSQAVAEAARRRREQIPPGYLDNKKKARDHQDGDYLVWRQLLNEAATHSRPVLLVCNENKDDWVRKGANNETLGPRPELVLEMQEAAGVALHTVTVVGLLKEAPKYLGASVSASTIVEAKSLPSNKRVEVVIANSAKSAVDRMSGHQGAAFMAAMRRLEQEWSDEIFLSRISGYRRINSHDRDMYSMQWRYGSVILLVEKIEDASSIEGPLTRIAVLRISIRSARDKDDSVGMFDIEEVDDDE